MSVAHPVGGLAAGRPRRRGGGGRWSVVGCGPSGDVVAAVLVEGVVAGVMRSSPWGVSTTMDSGLSGAGSPAPQVVRVHG